MTSEETPDYNFDYEYEGPDIYKRIYQISSDFNVIFQFFTIFINFFHLIVLLQKELRVGAIYILMIGISTADFFSFLVDLWYVAYEREWITVTPFFFNAFCLDSNYVAVNPWAQIIGFIVKITRPVAIWLAIFMALIRTLSVIFPMSNWIQKMAQPKYAGYFVSGTFGFWTVYYTWNVVFWRVVWYPDYLNEACIYYRQHKTQTQYVTVMTLDNYEYSMLQERLEPYVRLIPTVLYPILTVVLLYQLRTIKKKRQKVNKNSLNDRSDNTTKIILFMTASFMLSEGLAGLNTMGIMILTDDLYSISSDVSNLISILGTFQFICNNFRTINATSHCFVCFLMSSQYREAVKKMFCCKKKQNGTNIKVSAASMVSLQSISGKH